MGFSASRTYSFGLKQTYEVTGYIEVLYEKGNEVQPQGYNIINTRNAVYKNKNSLFLIFTKVSDNTVVSR
jgi:hypothetical protein